jgi:5'-nucleotidase
LSKFADPTPLHLDSTHDAVLQELRNWTIPGFTKEPA